MPTSCRVRCAPFHCWTATAAPLAAMSPRSSRSCCASARWSKTTPRSLSSNAAPCMSRLPGPQSLRHVFGWRRRCQRRPFRRYAAIDRGLSAESADEVVTCLREGGDRGAGAGEPATQLLVAHLDRQQRVLQLGEDVIGRLDRIGCVLERRARIL